MAPINPYFLDESPDGDDDGGADDSHACASCGYDLRGTPLNRPCPECGAVHEDWAPPDDAGTGTPCRKCGTRVPGMAIGSLCMDCAGPLVRGHPKCQHCGYSMHGLDPGSLCPECGKVAGDGLPLVTTVKLPAMPMRVLRSKRWQAGLLLLTCAGGGWVFATALRAIHSITDDVWNVIVPATMMMVAAAGWCVTPRAIDGETRWMTPTRWSARLCVLGLPLATFADTTVIEAGLGFIGLVGLACVLWLLAMLSRVAEEMHVSRQFELGWMVCVPLGVLAWLLPIPGGAVTLDRSVAGWVMLFLMLVMLLPTVFMCWFIARPSLTLLQLSGWAQRNAAEAHRRDIKWKRSTACRHCGHTLDGVLPNAPCPRCGAVS